MDTLIEQLIDIINNMGVNAYIILGLLIVFFFLGIHLYSLKREKKKLIETINNNVKVFQKAFDIAEEGMLILSNKNEIIYANKTMRSLLSLNKDFQLTILKDMPQVKVKNEWIKLNEFIESQKSRLSEKALIFPQSYFKVDNNDDEIVINLHIDTMHVDSKEVECFYIVTIQDLTKVQETSRLGYKHKLTNIPNQLQALQDIPVLFSKIHLENNKIALILLSFDNFTRLRSIIGYEQANDVIIRFSKYLGCITSKLTVNTYHTFDNHFLLTVSNIESIEIVEHLVAEIQEQLASFYKIENENLHLTVSAGIAIYPDSGPTRNLLNNVYKALAQAEKEGNGKVSVYLPTETDHDYDVLKLYNDMQKGLDNGEFEVYYQPIVDTKGIEIVAAEALVRWNHSELGLISPDIFIGLMEKTGFIIKLGKYILEEVLKQQKRWELFKFKRISVSINVSMVEIATGEFVEHVNKQLRYHQLYPEAIKFEITEGMAMIGEAKTEQYFHELKKLGVGLSLDDFGTGYTSFSYLKKFPADSLKIDKSLVDNIMTKEEDQRIVRAMIELGHNLDMKVIIEGIETKDMVELLASYGCDLMQGYYFAKPLPVFEFQKLLR